MDFDTQFNRTRNGIVGMGCFIAVFNILLLAGIIAGVVYGCNQVKKKGLKGVVNDVWEGPTNSVSTNAVPE